MIVGLSSELGLDPYPVATALWQIGNPAVPTLKQVFYSDSRLHFLAGRTLCIIDTPTSKAALREFLARESEPGLPKEIESCLTDRPIR
jgi:hypothetical protein